MSLVNESVKKFEVLINPSFPVEGRKLYKVSALKNELSGRSFALLQADKSGQFAVLPVGTFNKRALAAISELFEKTREVVLVVKCEVRKVPAED